MQKAALKYEGRPLLILKFKYYFLLRYAAKARANAPNIAA